MANETKIKKGVAAKKGELLAHYKVNDVKTKTKKRIGGATVTKTKSKIGDTRSTGVVEKKKEVAKNGVIKTKTKREELDYKGGTMKKPDRALTTTKTRKTSTPSHKSVRYL